MNADTVTGVTLTSDGAPAASAVGSCAIVPSAAVGTGLTNYAITYVNGALTINKATLTVSADSTSRVYGDANPTFTATYSGFKNGETLATSGVTGSPSLTTLATPASTVPGPYTITAAIGTLASDNYSFSFVNSQLTIDKATLTVTADSTSRVYGDANPTFTASYSGFKNGETLATSGVTGSPSLTTLATPASTVPGPYTITAAIGTLASDNYSFSFVNSQLTIDKATLTVTADSISRVYGDANPTFAATYSGFKNGETLASSGVTGSPSLTTLATPASAVPGPYTITAAIGTLASGNYDFAFVDGALTVNPAPTTTTVTSSQNPSTYGDAVTFTATVTATPGTPTGEVTFKDGATILATITLSSSQATYTTSSLSVGDHTITAVYSGDTSFAASAEWLEIQIYGAPSITTASLPDGNVGVYYHQYLDYTGGADSYTWSMVSGNLPAGLSLNYSGQIYGTPTAAGTWDFAVQLIDTVGGTATASLSITISVGPAITTTSLSEGNVNASYSETVYAAGGTTPYTWSIDPEALPAGLSLDSFTGAITGMPTTAGTYDFTVQVTDDVGDTATASLSITISAAPGITTTWISDAEVGIAFSGTVTATGGTTPYTWSIASGTLPAGLSLDSFTGAITGMPTTAGTYSFAVRVAGGDEAASTQGLFYIYVSEAPSITTTSLPDGNVGVDYSEYLDVTGGIYPHTWSITSGNLLPDGLLLDSWGDIYGTPTTVGTWDFTVQLVDGAGVTTTVSLSITINADQPSPPHRFPTAMSMLPTRRPWMLPVARRPTPGR